MALLREMLRSRLSAEANAWLDAELAAPADTARLLAAFTAAARRAGKAPLAPTAGEMEAAHQANVQQPLHPFTTDELVRALLLARAVEGRTAEEAAALVRRAYDDGDNRERRAVLRALPLLPDPERHLALAIEACRSHVLPVFEAIALDNTYPATFFPELNFNQMALKTAFVELPISRIVLLQTRMGAELDRMARDYAAEREAAGRPVPDDLSLLHL